MSLYTPLTAQIATRFDAPFPKTVVIAETINNSQFEGRFALFADTMIGSDLSGIGYTSHVEQSFFNEHSGLLYNSTSALSVADDYSGLAYTANIKGSAIFTDFDGAFYNANVDNTMIGGSVDGYGYNFTAGNVNGTSFGGYHSSRQIEEDAINSDFGGFANLTFISEDSNNSVFAGEGNTHGIAGDAYNSDFGGFCNTHIVFDDVEDSTFGGTNNSFVVGDDVRDSYIGGVENHMMVGDDVINSMIAPSGDSSLRVGDDVRDSFVFVGQRSNTDLSARGNVDDTNAVVYGHLGMDVGGEIDDSHFQVATSGQMHLRASEISDTSIHMEPGAELLLHLIAPLGGTVIDIDQPA